VVQQECQDSRLKLFAAVYFHILLNSSFSVTVPLSLTNTLENIVKQTKNHTKYKHIPVPLLHIREETEMSPAHA
jgi:hypothetical protein